MSTRVLETKSLCTVEKEQVGEYKEVEVFGLIIFHCNGTIAADWDVIGRYERF